MIKHDANSENAPALEQSSAGIGKNVSQIEQLLAQGVYTVTCTAPIEERLVEYTELLERIITRTNEQAEKRRKFKRQLEIYKSGGFLNKLFNLKPIIGLKDEMAATELMDAAMLRLLNKKLEAIPTYEKWTDTVHNLVTTVGKNDLLDKYLAGSTYTAAWFLGLISSVSYTAVAVGDTMASHAGWLEAGAANVPIYSQGARPTAAWSAAAAGSKALSSALAYTIATTGGTVKGCFLTSVATKDGTTGILYSAGLFTGGDKVVAVADTLNVSYTASV